MGTHTGRHINIDTYTESLIQIHTERNMQTHMRYTDTELYRHTQHTHREYRYTQRNIDT